MGLGQRGWFLRLVLPWPTFLALRRLVWRAKNHNMNRHVIGFSGVGAFLLLSSLSPQAVRAQAKAAPASEAAAKADAEKAGKEGERLLAQHDAAGAVGELSKAFSLSRNTKFLLPLGLAYAEAERPLDALDALGRYLKEAPAIPDAKRREIGTKLGVMMDQVSAPVTVEATRQNAAVKVDGRPVGTTPIDTPLRLLPGKHEIIMAPAATDPSSGAKVQIDVKPGMPMKVKLEPGARSRFLEPQAQNEGQPQQDGASAEPAQRSDSETTPTVATNTPATAASGSSEFSLRELPKKWWFWTGVGAVAVLGVGLGVGLGVRNTSSSAEFPAVPTWPGGVVDARTMTLVTVSGIRL